MPVFFAELKRRRVLQAGGAYIAGAWLGAEILQFLLAQFQAPDWTYRVLALVLVVGFPVAMMLAWTIQVQDDGSWALDRERGDYRTLTAAIALAIVATTGLSWLIVPDRHADPRFEPIPDSIAVIPFLAPANHLYDELMRGLKQSRELRIVSLARAPGTVDPDELGRQLLARSVAWADVEGDQLVISLFDVVDDRVIWQNSYALPSAFGIANDLLSALDSQPLSREAFMGTDDEPSYQAWLAAVSAEDLEQLIARDPDYARAHVSLAQTLTGNYGLMLDEHARKAVDTALALDPDSADALSLYGLGADIRQLRVQAFERAIELDPDHHLSYYRYAMEMQRAGELEVAENLIRQALLFAPQDERYREVLDEIMVMKE